MAHERAPGAAYRAAGVDVAAGELAVEMIRERARAATRPEVLGDIGGFAAAFAPRLAGLAEPVLVSATDGVGTKLAIAQTLGRHDTVGLDLVAGVVDDLVCQGAEPLFFLDYLACGRLVPERVAEIVGGIAEGCRAAGCALVGGETAEHPGVMGEDEYDLAGFAVGIVERERMLGPTRVLEGDAVVGLASSGLHSNGYSLVRKLILDHDLDLSEEVPALGRTLGEELMRPTRIYAPALLALIEKTEVHAAAHVTGGGIEANVARAVPPGLAAVLRAGSWPEPPIFEHLRRIGGLTRAEMTGTFNCGLGMAVVVPRGSAPEAIALLETRGERAFLVGEIAAGEGARIEG
ncbi:MAG: phosphoribosylformylglycinamidine cyclo-ligase [Acidobacteria bacterium]|nr:phosphoribosylformylglycinamidine cyclo-ligase [Acidobacteriota bacterium]